MKCLLTRDTLTTDCIDLLGKVISSKVNERILYQCLTIRVQGPQVILEGHSICGSIRVTKPEGGLEDGEIFVPFSAISSLIKSLHKEDTLAFHTVDNLLNVVAKREDATLFNVDIPTASEEHVPYVLSEPTEVRTCAHVAKDLSQVFALCDKTDYAFPHRGVFFSRKYAFGGTGTGLGVLLTEDIGEDAFILDPLCNDIFNRMGNLKFHFGTDICKVQSEDETVEYFARYLTSAVPNIEKFLSDFGGLAVGLNRDTTLGVLKQVHSLISSSDSSGTFDFSKDTLQIKNRSLQRGKGQFFVAVQSEDEFTLELSIPAMITAISSFNTEDIKMFPGNHNNMIKLESGNFSVVVPKLK